MSAATLEVTVNGLARKQHRYLSSGLRRAWTLLHSHVEEISLAIVNDADMSRLHKRFLGVDGPTDVLTFELDQDPDQHVTSGEIVICAPFARRQSRRLKTRFCDELLLYALHGLLHLSGYDDRTQRDFDRMHRAEDRILQRLGVGAVFAPRSRKTRR